MIVVRRVGPSASTSMRTEARSYVPTYGVTSTVTGSSGGVSGRGISTSASSAKISR